MTTLDLTIVGRDRFATTMTKLNLTLDKLSTKLDRLDGKKVRIPVDVDDKGASSKLGLLNSRLLDLNRSVGAAHVTWSKLGVLLGSHNIQRGAQAIGAAFKVAGVEAIGLGAAIGVSGLFNLANSLLPAVGAIGLLPAGFALAGATAATLAIGLSGVGDSLKLVMTTAPLTTAQQEKLNAALANLAPSARESVLAIQSMRTEIMGVRTSVQEGLFAGLATDIRALGSSYLPVVTTGLTGIAVELNTIAHTGAGVLERPDTVNQVAVAFGNMRAAMAGLGPAVAPATSALVTLTSVGSAQLPVISEAFSSLTIRAAAWVSTAAQTGRLNEIFAQAIATIGQLIGLVGNLGSVLYSVMAAAGASGASFLTVMSTVVGSLAAFLRSTEGQTMLLDFFGAVHIAMINLMPVLTALGGLFTAVFLPLVDTLLPVVAGAFGSLAPAIAPFGAILTSLEPVLAQVALSLSGVVAGALNALAPALIQLAPLFAEIVSVVGTGLVDVFNQLGPPLLTIATALSNALAPVLPQLASAFADIIVALTPIINVAVALSPLFGQIAVAFTQVIIAATPLITILAGFLGNVLAAILPILGQLVMSFGNFLVAALNAVTPLLGPLIAAFEQILAAILPILPSLLDMATTLITALAPILPTIADLIIRLTLALLPLLPPILQIISALLPPFIALVQALMPVLIQLANIFIALVVPILNTIVIPALNAVAWIIENVLAPVLNWLIDNVVRPVFNAIGNAIKGASDFIGGIFNGIKDAVHAVGQVFQDVGGWIGDTWNKIQDAARIPVEFVVNHVLNPLILGWDDVVNFLHLGFLSIPTIKMATGGVLTGPGGPTDDMIPVLASAGEYIVNAGSTRKHRALLESINADRYAGGGLIDITGQALSDLWNYLTDPVGTLLKDLGKIIPGASGINGFADSLLDMPRKFLDGLTRVLKDNISKAIGISLPGGPSARVDLARVVVAVLSELHLTLNALNAVMARIQMESGGNAAAVNKWDINWQRGTPSVGLMQVIGPTFRAYAGPYAGVGPFLYGTSIDPHANIYAGVNYATHRYGSGWIAKMTAPGGYEFGGFVNRPTVATLGESGTELVLPLSQPRRVGQLLRQAGLLNSPVSNRNYHLTVIANSFEQADLIAAFKKLEAMDGPL